MPLKQRARQSNGRELPSEENEHGHDELLRNAESRHFLMFSSYTLALTIGPWSGPDWPANETAVDKRERLAKAVEEAERELDAAKTLPALNAARQRSYRWRGLS